MEINPRGIGTLTKVVTVMLYLGLAMAIGITVFVLLTRMGVIVPMEQLGATLDAADLTLTILTYFVFGRWIWVASRNLWDRDVDGLQYTPASCIWWYAVPIGNLFKPYGAMREIWNASHGANEDYLAEGHPILQWWWGFWIANSIANNIAARLGEAAPMLFLISSAISIPLYVFAIRLVSAIGKAQTKGLQQLAETFA